MGLFGGELHELNDLMAFGGWAFEVLDEVFSTCLMAMSVTDTLQKCPTL